MCGSSSSITLLLPAAMSSILSDHHTSCKWCQSAAHSITPLLRWKVQISSFTTRQCTTTSFISFLCFSHATFGSAIILQVLFFYAITLRFAAQAILTIFFFKLNLVVSWQIPRISNDIGWNHKGTGLWYGSKSIMVKKYFCCLTII